MPFFIYAGSVSAIIFAVACGWVVAVYPETLKRLSDPKVSLAEADSRLRELLVPVRIACFQILFVTFLQWSSCLWRSWELLTNNPRAIDILGCVFLTACAVLLSFAVLSVLRPIENLAHMTSETKKAMIRKERRFSCAQKEDV